MKPEKRAKLSTTDVELTWRDSRVLMNCLTIAMIACLVPQRPLTDALYLTASTGIFVALAFMNHLFPLRLRSLTHVVKAAYTNLLFASVAPWLGWHGRMWLLSIGITILDLLPLFLRNGRLQAISEGLGAASRWILIGSGFYFVRAPIPILLPYAICTAVYFFERRDRIHRGRRFAYGWLHCLEHLAIWGFLLLVNSSRLNWPLMGKLYLGFFATIAISLIITGFITNVRILRSIERRLPPWFDPRLRDAIVRKSCANAFSHRLWHYVFQPFNPKIVNVPLDWSDIEAMVFGIPIEEDFDVIVGIASGGAFIARCVAARLGVDSVHYMQSSFWSRGSLYKEWAKAFRYYAGLSNHARTSFLDREVDLSGKRVLIVDDSVCTGTTQAAVVRLCRERGAGHVKTLALFVHPAHPADYFYLQSRTPLVWPWGWESD